MKRKRSAADIIFDTANAVLMTIFCFMCIYPFYYIFVYAFSNPQKADFVVLWPVAFTLGNFRSVFLLEGIGQAAVISVLRTVTGTVSAVLVSSFFGYLMTKQEMYGRRFIYRLAVFSQYVSAGLIPTYLVMRAYGFYNTFLVYIVPGLVSVYFVILVKTYVEQIPVSLEESARLDGAGPIRCWWAIILPLTIPILATTAVFAAVAHWNAWFDAQIYITNERLWPLQYLLQRYLSSIKEEEMLRRISGMARTSITIKPTSRSLRLTITAVVTVPILFVYPWLQRYFVKGIMMGAVKG